MWMVGSYNEGSEFNMPDHAFNGRKLRPLVPRPLPSPISHHHATDFFTQCHNLVGDQSKRDQFNNNNSCSAPPVVASTRWNPTPEQLRALEELYRRGTRTPSAEQIQHITAQLRRFGKIEGKNVFYWFQNHKARERQKRRRQVVEPSATPLVVEDHHHYNNNLDHLEKKDLGASRTRGFEVEQTSKNNNWAPSSNCSVPLSEESVSIQQRAAKAAAASAAAAAVAVAECRTEGGWVQFHDGEFQQQLQQQRRNFMERNATWQMLHPSSSSCPTNTIPIMATTTASSKTNSIIATNRVTLVDPKLLKNYCDNNICFFNIPPLTDESIIHSNSEEDDHHRHNNNNHDVDSQTLQLFPLRSGGGDNGCYNINNQKQKEISVCSMDSNFNPASHQFFEFLPLKN